MTTNNFIYKDLGIINMHINDINEHVQQYKIEIQEDMRRSIADSANNIQIKVLGKY